VASLASNKRAPFDLPESESELVAGFHTEYSGLRFSFFFFAEYAAMFVVGGIQAALFLGGWNDPFGFIGWAHARLMQSPETNAGWLILLNFLGAGIFVLKCMTIIFVQMWLRWTLPRPRIDQVLYACVKVLLPLACVLLLGSALWQLLAGDQPRLPWAPFPSDSPLAGEAFNPWNFAQWWRVGAAVPLVTQVVLAVIAVGAFCAVIGWVIYAAASGRNLKQRLTEPAPIDVDAEAEPAAA
jgi:hypothetical protein